MTRHYPDLGSTSDWSCRVGNLIQLIRSTTAKHQVTSGPGLKQITFRLKTRQALINQRNGANNFGRISKNGKKVIPRKVLLSFWKNFHRDEPFHLNSPWNYRVFHTNGKRSLATPWQGKTITLHVHRDFVYISLPSLHDYHGKMPNFTFCEGRKHAGNDKFSFSLWTWMWLIEIQLQKSSLAFGKVRKEATTKFYFSSWTWIWSLGIQFQKGSPTFEQVSGWE